MKKIFFLLGLVFSLVLLLPRPAFAQEGWVIENFHSDLTIRENGKLRVEETIAVDFGSLAKHGIFRDVPNLYKLDTGENFYLEIELLGVKQNGKDISYFETTKNGKIDIKIGDPNRTISGKAVYTIVYEVTGALRGFSDYDELYWDVTGESWPVSISAAGATLTLPKSSLARIDCFEGGFGSKRKCVSKLSGKTTATFSTSQSLSHGEGLTILASYPKNVFPILTPATAPGATTKNSNLPEFQPLNFFLAFLAVFVPAILFVFLRWWKGGRDLFNKGPHARETLVVEYSPPDALRPAELGTLVDERADTLDVSATIIDLAVRGYLTITETAKKWIFGNTDYKLTNKNKATAELLGYEKELLDRIFAGGKEAKISDLKTEFYDDLAIVKEKLYENMVSKKLFPTNPEKVRKLYLVWGFALLILGFSLFITFVFIWDILGGITLALGLVGLILTLFSHAMPRRTPAGYKLYRRALGFMHFINKAEKYKQRFFERKNLFNELLPYAIVFGETEKFAKALKDLGIEPNQPTWYQGTGAFNLIVFSSHINSFSGSLSGAISATGHSSFAVGGGGFSSGGGFSGGGFGGGGGGSW